jgi:hypothetical protein
VLDFFSRRSDWIHLETGYYDVFNCPSYSSRSSNPARSMDVCLLCLYAVLSCVGRGLCDGLITRPEESYRVSVCVWSRNPEKGGQRSVLDYKRLWIIKKIIDKMAVCPILFLRSSCSWTFLIAHPTSKIKTIVIKYISFLTILRKETHRTNAYLYRPPIIFVQFHLNCPVSVEFYIRNSLRMLYT